LVQRILTRSVWRGRPLDPARQFISTPGIWKRRDRLVHRKFSSLILVLLILLSCGSVTPRNVDLRAAKR